MNTHEQLIEYFRKFPGIGLRQAKRFTYFIMQKDNDYIENLTQAMKDIRKNMHVCPESFQMFYDENPQDLSPIARNPNRDRNTLMIVEKDLDLEAIEANGLYNGQYFVLGGRAPMVDSRKNNGSIFRINELKQRIQKGVDEDALSEIIFALSLNTEGEHTRHVAMQEIEDIIKENGITTSTLGRGMSTGTELEYIDTDTFKEALSGRKKI